VCQLNDDIYLTIDRLAAHDTSENGTNSLSMITSVLTASMLVSIVITLSRNKEACLYAAVNFSIIYECNPMQRPSLTYCAGIG
jgi:hypothetical protein